MGRNRKDISSVPTGQHDDDRLLWEKATQSVKRMNSQPAFQPVKHSGYPKTGSPKKSRTGCSQSGQTEQPKVRIATVKTSPADFRLGDMSGIDRLSARRMQRGQLPIEDRLDLHGLSQEQAHKKLNTFISRAVQQNFRHVLIITGKGRDGHGILRQKVPAWLRRAVVPLFN